MSVKSRMLIIKYGLLNTFMNSKRSVVMDGSFCQIDVNFLQTWCGKHSIRIRGFFVDDSKRVMLIVQLNIAYAKIADIVVNSINGYIKRPYNAID